MSITCPVIIFDLAQVPAYLAARTMRHLRSRGVAQSQIHLLEQGFVPSQLNLAADDLTQGLLLLRAGAWLTNHTWQTPPGSSTGKPLLALGAVRPCDPRLLGDAQATTTSQQLLANSHFANQPLAGDWRSDTHLFSAWLDAELASKLQKVGIEQFLDILHNQLQTTASGLSIGNSSTCNTIPVYGSRSALPACNAAEPNASPSTCTGNG